MIKNVTYIIVSFRNEIILVGIKTHTKKKQKLSTAPLLSQKQQVEKKFKSIAVRLPNGGAAGTAAGWGRTGSRQVMTRGGKGTEHAATAAAVVQVAAIAGSVLLLPRSQSKLFYNRTRVLLDDNVVAEKTVG